MDEPGREHVREALQVWNADAVWVVREMGVMEREMREGGRRVGDWTLRGLGGRGQAEEEEREGDDGNRWGLGEVVF